jgi:ubiquitin-protein ligase
MSINKILMRHLEHAFTHNCESLTFAIMGADLTKWYVLVSGIDGVNDCFKGGEYLIEFDTKKTMGPLKQAYPQEPPTFLVMTPNGKYGTDGKVCVSFGEFHNQNYRQDLGIAGFAELLIQGMVSTETIGEGIRIIDSKNESEIKKLAIDSKAYNFKRYKDVMIKLYITRFMLSLSGAWIPDKENPDRLNRVEDDKLRKAVAKKIMSWCIDATPEAQFSYIKNALITSGICAEITTDIDIKINELLDSIQRNLSVG